MRETAEVKSDQPSRTGRRRLYWLEPLVLVAAAVTMSMPWFHGNAGVVEQGRVYRSAQPLGGLASQIRESGLVSILDLRGGSRADGWYNQETRLCRRDHLDFYDFPMSASRRPTRRELLVLIDLFDRCRYPLLIHCKSGADRTGLASAVYLMAARGVPPEEAEGAFSLLYWHVPAFGAERLHAPITEYAGWLRRTHQPHTPERFRGWVENDYAGVADDAPFRPLRPGPRDRVVGSVIDDRGPAAR